MLVNKQGLWLSSDGSNNCQVVASKEKQNKIVGHLTASHKFVGNLGVLYLDLGTCAQERAKWHQVAKLPNLLDRFNNFTF